MGRAPTPSYICTVLQQLMQFEHNGHNTNRSRKHEEVMVLVLVLVLVLVCYWGSKKKESFPIMGKLPNLPTACMVFQFQFIFFYFPRISIIQQSQFHFLKMTGVNFFLGLNLVLIKNDKLIYLLWVACCLL